MFMKELSSGAEAIVYLDGSNVLKDRIEKTYRIKDIDLELRKSRTRREAKILEKLSKSDIAPRVVKVTDTAILMEKISGLVVKKVLDKNIGIAKLIGEKLTILHNNNIIHSDLTTSNMIYDESTKKFYFIDFGLSFVSSKVEDKAVDLHLFKQALDSKHYAVYDEAYKLFLKGYNPKDRTEILNRLKIVEARGRYKEKV